eukprot:982004-Prymnesium_polylepis.1
MVAVHSARCALAEPHSPVARLLRCGVGPSQSGGRTRGGRWGRLRRQGGREEALYWRCARRTR